MKALEYLLTQAWAIRPDVLEIGLSIVLREHEPQGVWAIEAQKGTAADGSEAGMTRRGRVAVIPITGPIFRYADYFTSLCGGCTTESLARDLALALDDGQVDSILLNVDSPGGQAAGIGELAAMIRGACDRKRVVAYAGDACASAAYWLAAACDRIVAAPTASLGSIGVVSGYPTKKDDPRRVEFVSSQSPNKRPDVGTERGRAQIQAMVDDLASVFIASVADYRGVTADAVVADFGAGGVLIGAKAVEAGMADDLGSFESTLAELAASPPRRPRFSMAATSTHEGITMNDTTTGTGTATAPAPAPPQVPADILEQLAALRTANQALVAEKIADRAAAFVTRMTLEEQRFTPAIADAFRPLVLAILQDDHVLAVAAGPTRLKLLEDVCRALPKTGLGTQAVHDTPIAREAIAALDAAGAVVLPADRGDNGKPTPKTYSSAEIDSFLDGLIPASRN